MCGEKICYKFPEFDSCLLIVSYRFIKFNKTIKNIFTVFIFIFRRKFKTPWNTVSGDLRFICEKAFKFIAEFFIVWLIDLIDEILSNFKVKSINIERIHIVIKTVSVFIYNKVFLIRIFAFFIAKIFLLVIESFSIDFTAAETAGPTVFIISPCVHSCFFSFISTCAYIVEPFVAHVFCLKTTTCMHEEPADTSFIHLAYLFTSLFSVEFFIPGPERYRSVFFWYIFKIHNRHSFT